MSGDLSRSLVDAAAEADWRAHNAAVLKVAAHIESSVAGGVPSQTHAETALSRIGADEWLRRLAAEAREGTA